MAGLVPAIHALFLQTHQDVDARDERGHDERWIRRQNETARLRGRFLGSNWRNGRRDVLVQNDTPICCRTLMPAWRCSSLSVLISGSAADFRRCIATAVTV